MSRYVENLIDGLFAFARVVGSKQSNRVRNVLFDLLGDTDPATGRPEKHDEQIAYGLSPIVYRPQPGEETLGVRRGDQTIIIGTRETRWQVTIEAGECVIRGLGPNAARIRLKPGGEVHVEAGALSAAIALALDSLVQAELQKIFATLASGSNGAGPVVWATPYVVGSTASKRIKVDS